MKMTSSSNYRHEDHTDFTSFYRISQSLCRLNTRIDVLCLICFSCWTYRLKIQWRVPVLMVDCLCREWRFYTFSIESLLDIAAESLKLRRTRLLDNVGKFYFVSCAPQLFCSFFKEIRSENRCSVAAEIRLINPGRNRLRLFLQSSMPLEGIQFCQRSQTLVTVFSHSVFICSAWTNGPVVRSRANLFYNCVCTFHNC